MTCAEWVRHHLELFGMVSEADASLVTRWAKLFESRGYSGDELRSASDRIAMEFPPEYRSHHLARLVDTLKSQRQRQASRFNPVYVPVCGLCRGTGLVSVPYFESIRKLGGWYTCAVACDCPLGIPWQSRTMSFQQYELSYPDWQEREREHEESERQVNEAHAEASQADEVFGRIMRKLQAPPRA